MQANRSTTLGIARPSGAQTLAVRLAAEANAARATTTVRPGSLIAPAPCVRRAKNGPVVMHALDTEHLFCHHGNRCSPRRSSVASCSSLVGVLLLWALFAGETGASGPERQYRVRPGDTLWSIAERTFPGDPREGVWELRRAERARLGA